MTRPSMSNVRKTFDIVYDINIRGEIERYLFYIEGMKP
jgi:hypothetical protein